MTVAREVTVKLNADVQKAVTDLTKAVDKITKLVAGLQKTSAATKKSSKEFSKGTKSMASSAKTLEKRLGSLRSNMTGLSESFRKISIGAVAAFGALAATASVIVKISADFELGMSKAAAVASGSSLAFGGAFKSMRKEAIKTANITIHTAKQVTGAMEFMAMAGFSAAEVIATIGEVAKLATAANITMAESGNVLTNIMSTFGITAVNVRSELTRTTAGMVDQGAVAQELGKQLTDVNNILVGVFTNSNVNVLQLGEAFKIVGAVASAADVSLKDVAVSIGLLGNVGIQGTLAGTSLKRAFSALVKPTKQSAKAMGRLGLTTEVLRERQKGQASGMLRVIAILEKMKKKYAETGKTTQYVADLMEVFGERSGPGMAALVKQGTDAFIDLSVATKQAQFDDITTFLQNIQHETTTGKLKILKSNVESLAIAIGDLLLPKLNDLVDRVKDVVNSFSAGDGTLIRFIANYGQAALVIGAVTSALALLAATVTAGFAAFIFFAIFGPAAGITFAAIGTAVGGAALAFGGLTLATGTALLGAEAFNAALGRQGMAAIDLGYSLDTASFGYMGLVKQMKAFVGLSNEIDRMEFNQEIFKGADAAMRLSSADLRLDAMMDDMAALDTASSGLFQKALTVQIGAEITSFDKVSDFKKFYKELFDSIGKDSGGLFEEALNPAQMDVYENRLNEITGNIATTSKLLSRVDLTPKQIAKAQENLDDFVNQLEQLRGEIKVNVSDIEEIAAKVKVTVETEGRTEAIAEKAREVSPVLQAFLDSLKELEMERLKKTLQKINDMINEGDKSVGKLLVKATEAFAKQEDQVDKTGKLWDSFFDWIGGKIRSLSAKLISAFKPSMKPSIQAGAFIDKFIADAGKKLDRIAKDGGGKLSGRSSEEIKKFGVAVGLTAMEAIRLASSFVDVKKGAIRHSDASYKQIKQITAGMAPHIDRLNEFSKSVGGVSVAFGDLTDIVYAMAIAQEDYKKKINSATSSVEKLQKSYDESVASLANTERDIKLEIAVLQSESPEITRLMQDIGKQKSGVDETIKAIKENAEALRRESILLESLNAGLAVQGPASELMVATMNNLGIDSLAMQMSGLETAVLGNTAAILGRTDEPDTKANHPDAVEALRKAELKEEYQKALEAYQDAMDSSAKIATAAVADINKDAKDQNKGTDSKGDTTKDLLDVKGQLDFRDMFSNSARSVKELNSMLETFGKGAADAVKGLEIMPLIEPNPVDDKSVIKDILTSAFSGINTFYVKNGEIVAENTVFPGMEAKGDGLQGIVDMIETVSNGAGEYLEGLTDKGGAIGGFVGGAIGTMFGNSVMGKKIGEFVGRAVEMLVVVIPKAIMAGFNFIKSGFDKIASGIAKAANVVPEPRWQDASKNAAKIFAPLAAAVIALSVPLAAVLVPAVWTLSVVAVAAYIAFGIWIGVIAAASQQYWVYAGIVVAVLVTLAAALSLFIYALAAAISIAAGGAISSLLLALGMKQIKHQKIAGMASAGHEIVTGQPSTSDPREQFRRDVMENLTIRDPGATTTEQSGETTDLGENYRTPWTRIMDALAVSIDRVIFAMGPFYENLFSLVGLFDMVMDAFVVIAQSMGNLNFAETLYDIFKRLALAIVATLTALAHMHNTFVSIVRVLVYMSTGFITLHQFLFTLPHTFEIILFEFQKVLGEFANSLLPGSGNSLINSAQEELNDLNAQNPEDYIPNLQSMLDLAEEITTMANDMAQYINPDQFKPIYDMIDKSEWTDGLGRFGDLDDIAGAGDRTDKEFGEQLTNVPTGFKVNLARYKAMDAEGEGAAGDGDGGSLWSMGSNEYFRRLEDAIRNGNDLRGFMEGQSLSELGEEIRNMVDNLMDPASWGDIFGNSIREVGDELGNAVDSLTNTLGFALLGPEEAFQGGGGMGAAMGGRQAGGNITSGSNTMNININELSIADAANPDQLANMIAERSTRNQMAQAGTPFPSHQSGSGWWGGNEGGGGRS